jgi:hypothetical protein
VVVLWLELALSLSLGRVGAEGLPASRSRSSSMPFASSRGKRRMSTTSVGLNAQMYLNPGNGNEKAGVAHYLYRLRVRCFRAMAMRPGNPANHTMKVKPSNTQVNMITNVAQSQKTSSKPNIGRPSIREWHLLSPLPNSWLAFSHVPDRADIALEGGRLPSAKAILSWSQKG